MARALSKKEVTMRSSAISFEVCSGPLSDLQLEADSAPERVTVTNGEADQQRLLLAEATLQLTDAYGNAVREAGLRVCVSVQWPEGSEAAANGGVLPQLESSIGKLDRQTDRHGRVSFGSLSVKQGSGKACNDENQPANTQGNAMACVLSITVSAGQHDG